MRFSRLFRACFGCVHGHVENLDGSHAEDEGIKYTAAGPKQECPLTGKGALVTPPQENFEHRANSEADIGLGEKPRPVLKGLYKKASCLLEALVSSCSSQPPPAQKELISYILNEMKAFSKSLLEMLFGLQVPRSFLSDAITDAASALEAIAQELCNDLDRRAAAAPETSGAFDQQSKDAQTLRDNILKAVEDILGKYSLNEGRRFYDLLLEISSGSVTKFLEDRQALVVDKELRDKVIVSLRSVMVTASSKLGDLHSAMRASFDFSSTKAEILEIFSLTRLPKFQSNNGPMPMPISKSESCQSAASEAGMPSQSAVLSPGAPLPLKSNSYRKSIPPPPTGLQLRLRSYCESEASTLFSRLKEISIGGTRTRKIHWPVLRLSGCRSSIWEEICHECILKSIDFAKLEFEFEHADLGSTQNVHQRGRLYFLSRDQARNLALLDRISRCDPVGLPECVMTELEKSLPRQIQASKSSWREEDLCELELFVFRLAKAFPEYPKHLAAMRFLTIAAEEATDISNKIQALEELASFIFGSTILLKEYLSVSLVCANHLNRCASRPPNNNFSAGVKIANLLDMQRIQGKSASFMEVVLGFIDRKGLNYEAIRAISLLNSCLRLNCHQVADDLERFKTNLAESKQILGKVSNRFAGFIAELECQLGRFLAHYEKNCSLTLRLKNWFLESSNDLEEILKSLLALFVAINECILKSRA